MSHNKSLEFCLQCGTNQPTTIHYEEYNEILQIRMPKNRCDVCQTEIEFTPERIKKFKRDSTRASVKWFLENIVITACLICAMLFFMNVKEVKIGESIYYLLLLGLLEMSLFYLIDMFVGDVT